MRSATPKREPSTAPAATPDALAGPRVALVEGLAPLIADANRDLVMSSISSLAVGMAMILLIYRAGLSLITVAIFGVPGGYGSAAAFIVSGSSGMTAISLGVLVLSSLWAWRLVDPFGAPTREDGKSDPILHPAPARTMRDVEWTHWEDVLVAILTAGPRQVLESIALWRDRIAPGSGRRERAATMLLAIGRSGVPAASLKRDAASIATIRDLTRLRLIHRRDQGPTPRIEATDRGQSLLSGSAP